MTLNNHNGDVYVETTGEYSEIVLKTPKVRVDGDVYCFDGDVGISARIDGMDTRLDALNTTNEALKTKDTELSGRIDTLNTTDAELKTRLDALNSTDAELKNTDLALSNRIDGLSVSEQVSRIDALNSTDDALKAKDTELSGRIDTLNTTDDALKAKDTELSGRMDTLNTTDDALKAKDTELSGRIDTLNTTDDALKAKDTELSERMDTLNTTDDALKTRLDALETRADYLDNFSSSCDDRNWTIYAGDGGSWSDYSNWDLPISHTYGTTADKDMWTTASETISHHCTSCGDQGYLLGGSLVLNPCVFQKVFVSLPEHTYVIVDVEYMWLKIGLLNSYGPSYVKFLVDSVQVRLVPTQRYTAITDLEYAQLCSTTAYNYPDEHASDVPIKVTFGLFHTDSNLTLTVVGKGWTDRESLGIKSVRIRTRV